MSVKMMHMVFERFPLPGNDMVLALALADHAHDDGTNIFPGNERLATKTRMSERTVIRLLQKFVGMGWLIKVRNADSRRGLASVYNISPEWINGKELVSTKESSGDKLSPNNSESLSDNLSPINDDVLGDKSEHWVTNRAVLGDTAMSPQPSLTINTTINTARETEQVDKKPSMTPEGLLACRLIELKIGVTSMHPTLHAWVKDRIPIDFIEQCIALARQRKPLPEIIAPNYLDKIIRSELQPKQDNSWMMTEKGVEAKGRELGIHPKQGESWKDYKARLMVAVMGDKR